MNIALLFPRLIGIGTILLLLTTTLPTAQERPLTLAGLYDPNQRINFTGRPISLRWLDDQHFYESDTFSRVDAVTADRSSVIDTEQFESALSEDSKFSSVNAASLARRTSHIFNHTHTALVFEWKQDLYFFDLETSLIRRLTDTPEIESEISFSPDGRFIAFVRNNNLFLIGVDGTHDEQLTADGTSQVRNGQLDWVYQEEIYGRGNFRGYWWSPDSTKLAYLQLDDRAVPPFTIVDHIETHPNIEQWSYPKAGDTNPNVRLGVLNLVGDENGTTWAEVSNYDPNNRLIVDVAWTPSSSHVIFQVQNREQTWLDFNLLDPANGSIEQMFRETSSAWVNVSGTPEWLADGTLVVLSERSGWKHLYHVDQTGNVIGELTSGEWEVRELHGVDEASGIVYFSGTKRDPTGLDIYRVKIDGSDFQRLSTEPGTHRAQFNPGLNRYVDTWSDISTPPQTRVHNAIDGSVIRVISSNTERALQSFRLPSPEFLQVSNRDGFVMEALMIKPPDFDPLHRYPVYQHVYGGPHIQRVQNVWRHETLYWQLLAQQGIIVWVLDNSTASGKGAVSTWPVYERFGELELRDLEDGLDWLTEQPYIDSARIGIEGWSYGGFMVSYALTHSKRWTMGIAGGSVTDWRNYDSIYTERYMRTPQNNPNGYQRSSPRLNADNLHGALLLVHGSMDENVHMQNTLQFAYALQQAGKQFEMMIYPKSRHRLGGPTLEYHRRQKMLDFAIEHLKPTRSAAFPNVNKQ